MPASPPCHSHPCAERERKCRSSATHLVCGSHSPAGCTVYKCLTLVRSRKFGCCKSRGLEPRSVLEEILRCYLALVLHLRLLRECATRCEADNLRTHASCECCRLISQS